MSGESSTHHTPPPQTPMSDTKQHFLSPNIGREFRAHSAPDITLAASPCCDSLSPTRLHTSRSLATDVSLEYSWNRKVHVYPLEAWKVKEQDDYTAAAASKFAVTDEDPRGATNATRPRRRRSCKRDSEVYFKDILQHSVQYSYDEDSDFSNQTLFVVFVILLAVGSALVISNFVLNVY